jgi:hypothetical protein
MVPFSLQRHNVLATTQSSALPLLLFLFSFSLFFRLRLSMSHYNNKFTATYSINFTGLLILSGTAQLFISISIEFALCKCEADCHKEWHVNEAGSWRWVAARHWFCWCAAATGTFCYTQNGFQSVNLFCCMGRQVDPNQDLLRGAEDDAEGPFRIRRGALVASLVTNINILLSLVW